MQEIEFRGIYPEYCLYEGQDKWIYGYLGKNIEENEYYIQSIKDNDDWGEGYRVLKDTVGQYIGIKDIHQKKVFQGDIVKVKRFIFKDCRREEVEGMEEYIGEVVWHQFGWHIAEKIKDGIRYHSLWLWNIKDDESEPDTHFMEIIGNKWDNTEMKVIE